MVFETTLNVIRSEAK